jgi:hypothetical protein
VTNHIAEVAIACHCMSPCQAVEVITEPDKIPFASPIITRRKKGVSTTNEKIRFPPLTLFTPNIYVEGHRYTIERKEASRIQKTKKGGY